MNTFQNIELMTIGQLIEDLAEFEEEYSDWDVVCWTPDKKTCYITRMEFDKDGALCLCLKEDDEDTYNVSMLIEELNEYNEDTFVYVAARGLYLCIETNINGTIFSEDLDENSDIDIVACNSQIIGAYKDDSYNDND